MDPEIDSVTWIKFGNKMAPLTLVANLATRWCHLHQLQIWPPDSATCISCKFCHQMAPLALVANLATRWRHLHKSTSLALPHCLELPPWHYQPVLSWYLHQPESHQSSLNKVSQGRTSGPNYRTPGLPGSDKNVTFTSEGNLMTMTGNQKHT